MSRKVNLFTYLLLVLVAVSFVKVSYAELTIDPSGNVGIGTTTPGMDLEIVDSSTALKVRSTGTDSQAHMMLQNDERSWKLYTDGTFSNSFFIRDNTIDTDRLTITTAGNIGIGLTMPTYKLHLDTGTSGYIGIDYDTNQYGGIAFRENSIPSGYIQINDTPSTDRMEFFVGGGSGADRKMVIQDTGNVGIGTTSPSKKLYVNGSAGGTQSWNASDRRWKKDIQTIPNALKGIMKIRGVQYNWKDGSVDESTGFDDKTHYGVIAQEVEAVFPCLVDNPGKSEEYKHVEYNALMGIMIEAVKELKTENDTVKAENNQLRISLTSLTDRLKTVESTLLSMSLNLPKDKLVMK